MASTGSHYNRSRLNRQILRRHRKHPASFCLHLRPQSIRFEDAKGRLLLEEPIYPDSSSSAVGGYAGSNATAGPSRLGGTMSSAATPGKELLKCIRNEELPNHMLDVLDARKVQFFEGCLIVEIKDHRLPPSETEADERDVKSVSKTEEEQPRNRAVLSGRIEGGRYGQGPAFLAANKAAPENARNGTDGMGKDGKRATLTRGPEVYRVVLHPNEETLWTELKMLNQRLSGGTWDEEEGLEVERQILNLTSAPLCLTPDVHATRIANLMLATTAPPARYLPSRPLPHQRMLPPVERKGIATAKVTLKDAEEDSKIKEAEMLEKQKREAIMRLMEGGWRMSAKDKNASGRTAQAHLPSSGSSSAIDRSFTPTFHRLMFIEKQKAKAGQPVGQLETKHPGSVEGAPAATNSEAAKGGDSGAKASSAVNPASSSKKTANKKRKQQESEAAGADESKDESNATAPKNKKKKTAAQAVKDAASPPPPPANDTKADSTSPEKKQPAKSKSKAKAKKANADADVSMNAAPPAADAPTPSVNGDADTSMASASGAKGGKKPAAKKAPVSKASKKTSQKTPAPPSRQSTATPALNNASLPNSSPARHAAASPFGHGNITTPSPAMSHAGIPPGANVGAQMGNQGFVNLPFGVSLPMGAQHGGQVQQAQQQQPQQQQQQQQQQVAAAAAMAAQFGLPMGGMGTNGTIPNGNNGLGLPFNFQSPPQQQQSGNNFSQFNSSDNSNANLLGMMGALGALPGNSNANSNNTTSSNTNNTNVTNNVSAPGLQQLQAHPNFSHLPVQMQQQLMMWQQRQQQHAASQTGQQQQQQPQQPQQQQHQQQQHQQQQPNTNLLPPNWPAQR